MRSKTFYHHLQEITSGKCRRKSVTTKGVVTVLDCTSVCPGGGGGYSLILAIKICATPHRVGFLSRFGLKTGIDFAHFGLESGMVFEGTTECMNLFIIFNSK